MFFKQFLREQSGCASYMVGDTGAGVCAVVDPHWLIDDYLETAKNKGLKITHIFETHVHADHISGGRKLAALTGAKIGIHRAGRAAYADLQLEDGDVVELGAVAVKVVHTPGHTPESIVLEVSDRERSPEPWLMLTGDTLFIDDVGRPDLAGPQGAAELFDSFQSKLLHLDGSIEVYPAHVAGSLCGRAMNLKASSTLGFERRFNRALQTIPHGKDFFIQNLTADLPAHSPSFDSIIAINRAGPPVHDTPPEMISPPEIKNFLGEHGVILDVRDAGVYAEEHIPGSITIPLSGGQVAGRAGWLIRSEENVLILAENEAQAHVVAGELGSIRAGGRVAMLEGGIDAWKATGGPTATLNQLSARDLDKMLRQGQLDTVLDVREPDEWQSDHIEGAVNISHREIRERFTELNPHNRIAVICAGGLRSVIAASVLEQNGFPHLYNVRGGMSSWLRNRREVSA